MSGGSGGSVYPALCRLGSCDRAGRDALKGVTDVLSEKMQIEVQKELERLHAMERELSGCISVRVHILSRPGIKSTFKSDFRRRACRPCCFRRVLTMMRPTNTFP